MPKFTLPPISPLIGTTIPNFFRVLKGRKIPPQQYVKVAFTFLILLVASIFHWVDQLYFKKKAGKFKFKEPPVFIIGHWRSGTTLLHNLLTRDPVAGYVTTYHAVFPNSLKSKWLFETFMKIFMPDRRPGDQVKLSVNFPQEDEYALSNLTHMAFYHFFYFPASYKEYYNYFVRFESLSFKDIEQWKLTYKKMVVKAAINTKGNRMILKNPVNTGRINRLIQIFPEARFIFMIRNPITVYLSSVKFFTQLFPTLNLEVYTRKDISEMVLDIYSKLLHDYLDLKEIIHPERLIEIRYEEFKSKPLTVLSDLYKNYWCPRKKRGIIFRT